MACDNNSLKLLNVGSSIYSLNSELKRECNCSEKEYNGKEGILYIIYQGIKKICHNKYYREEEASGYTRKQIIDVEGNVLIESDPEMSFNVYPELNIITIAFMDSDKDNNMRKRFKVLESDSLEVLYNGSIWVTYYGDGSIVENALKGIDVRWFGTFKLIETEQSTVLLNRNNKLVVDSNNIITRGRKIWHDNQGYHLRFTNAFLSEFGTPSTRPFTDYSCCEIITDRLGENIVSFYKAEVRKGVYSVVTELCDYDVGRPKLNLCLGNTVYKSSELYKEIYSCSTTRDAVMTEGIIDGEIARGCLSIKTGQIIIPLTVGLTTVVQLSDDIFIGLFRDEKDAEKKIHDLEIVSISKGMVVPRGLMNGYGGSIKTCLPIPILYRDNVPYVLGNDLKLHLMGYSRYTQTEGFLDYTVDSLTGAFDIKLLKNGLYQLNVFGNIVYVNKELGVMLKINDLTS